MPHENTIIASWDIPEYEESIRTNDWYWIIGAIALAGIIITIFTKNFLFAVIILLGTGLIFTYSIRKPKLVRIELSQDGLKIAHIFYPYGEMLGFWITEEVRQNKKPTQVPLGSVQEDGTLLVYHVLFATKKLYHPFVKVLLPGDMNPFELREFLLQNIEEREITEPLGYKISERLGF